MNPDSSDTHTKKHTTSDLAYEALGLAGLGAGFTYIAHSLHGASKAFSNTNFSGSLAPTCKYLGLLGGFSAMAAWGTALAKTSEYFVTKSFDACPSYLIDNPNERMKQQLGTQAMATGLLGLAPMHLGTFIRNHPNTLPNSATENISTALILVGGIACLVGFIPATKLISNDYLTPTTTLDDAPNAQHQGQVQQAQQQARAR